MTTKKISELASVTTASISGTDILPLVSVGATRKVTIDQIRSVTVAGAGVSGYVAVWTGTATLSAATQFQFANGNFNLQASSTGFFYAPKIEVGTSYGGGVLTCDPEIDSGNSVNLYGGPRFGSYFPLTTASAQLNVNTAFLDIKSLASSATVTMPAGFANSPGRMLFLCDSDGSCGSFSVTLRSADGNTFNGSSTFVLNSSRGFAGFVFDGTSKWTRFTG